MNTPLLLALCLLIAVVLPSKAAQPASDVIPTSAGDLTLTFIGHGSLMFVFGGKTVHVDPFGKMADYATLPKADLILITHEHFDHLDPEAIGKVRTPKTEIVLTELCRRQLGSGTVMTNGQTAIVQGLKIEAVPAYNLIHKRPDGQVFHARGAGNGYVVTFGDKRIYVAGDTENIPEMADLKDIDCAFLPMNLPYTMTPEMASAAALIIHPKILYPYHYGETDPARLVELLKDKPGLEVRIRNLR